MTSLLKAVARILAKYGTYVHLICYNPGDLVGREGVHESAGNHIFLFEKGIKSVMVGCSCLYVRVLC
jgi:hypothetical protein